MSKYHSKSKHNIKCISKKYFQNLDKHLHFYAANILMKRDLAKFDGTLFCKQKTLPPSQLGYSVCVCVGGGGYAVNVVTEKDIANCDSASFCKP